MSLEVFAEGFCNGKSIHNKPWQSMDRFTMVEDTICNVHRTHETQLETVNTEA